jgi:hypothetical protein
MTKFTVFVIIVALRIAYHPVSTDTAPFASPSNHSASTTSDTPAKFMSINGSLINNKIILKWIIGENETAYCFEVEKSTDGKNFAMAALVFGTDKPAIDNYEFYEKAGNQKYLYRIKLINKDKKAEYSSVIEISPFV